MKRLSPHTKAHMPLKAFRPTKAAYYALTFCLYAAAFLFVSMNSEGVELFEEDEQGNINQRNIGVFKSQSFDREAVDQIKLVRQVRSLPQFSKLKLTAAAELEYHQTGSPRIEMEGSEATLRSLQIDVSAGTLMISSHALQSEGTAKLKLYGQRLEGVEIVGAADATFYDILVNRFDLQVRGAADITVKGKARYCALDSQGAGDVDQTALLCQNVKLSVFGASDIQLYAQDSIEGRVQGAGSVLVLGQPDQRTLQVGGAFEINYP